MARMVLTGSLWPASRRHGGQEGRALGGLQVSQEPPAPDGDPQDGPQSADEMTQALEGQSEPPQGMDTPEAKGQDPARGGEGAAA